MNPKPVILSLCLVSLGLPALAQRDVPPELHSFASALKIEIIVMEGDALAAKGTIQGDVDNLKDFNGTTRLRFADGSRWSVNAEINLAYEKGEHSSGRPAMLEVDVSDLTQLRSPSGESNTILPLRIFATQLGYHGSQAIRCLATAS
ncbi:hypothetical protein [Luteolibacter luteus]|uniref:Lipid/polyisoprenoid-binding YceI-like domain-containing protein n=1 Tax=Luteolibacter luteus TaxID=2728835 RepID=A0A858RG09_9BACT|nr:hypothetical protein [Luteolibacter luteus]QJE95369.1 hypothetical protein HHL09_06105 [Luteolibacter luteus]